MFRVKGVIQETATALLRVVCTYLLPSRDLLWVPFTCLQVLTTTLRGASRLWRPRAILPHPLHRPLDIGSDQSRAVLRVRVTFFLTITTAINVRHHRPHSTSDPDLTLLFVQHRPSLLLYAQQIPASLASSLRLLDPPFLPLLNPLYRISNQTLALVHIPCL